MTTRYVYRSPQVKTAFSLSAVDENWRASKYIYVRVLDGT